MADVGVSELRQRLSMYLKRAERGEVIRIAERGRPKAVLGPLPGRDRIEQGIAEGWITPPSKGRLGSVQRRPGRRRILDVLEEDRGT